MSNLSNNNFEECHITQNDKALTFPARAAVPSSIVAGGEQMTSPKLTQKKAVSKCRFGSVVPNGSTTWRCPILQSSQSAKWHLYFPHTSVVKLKRAICLAPQSPGLSDLSYAGTGRARTSWICCRTRKLCWDWRRPICYRARWGRLCL